MRDVRETLDPFSAVHRSLLTTLLARPLIGTLSRCLLANFKLVPLKLSHEAWVRIDEPAT